MDDVKKWWHARIDEVSGIDKLIGEDGSMFREYVVKPAGLVLIMVILGRLWASPKKDGD